MAIPETLREIAERIVETNRSGDPTVLLDEIYADDVVSAESQAMPGQSTNEVVGLEALRAKWAWWESASEVHSVEVDGPFYHGADRFGVIFGMDVTDKQSGERTQMRELGIYTVRDGKVVREEFFY